MSRSFSRLEAPIRNSAGYRGDCSERVDLAGASRIPFPPARQRGRYGMDNITHTLTGVVLSRAGLNRWHPQSIWLLMLAANIPDIDIVAALRGALPYFIAHRGYTHSIVMAPLMALIPMLVVCAVSRSMQGWKAAYVLCLIGVASHLLRSEERRVGK